jgi:two-component system, chemotaxis family, response regulator Rcp1
MSHLRQLLLVEDNPGDVLLFRLFFAELQPAIQITVASDGLAAWDLLHHDDAPAGTFRPEVIVLDSGLPKRDGWEVLAALRNDAALWATPVVMFTAHPRHATLPGSARPDLYLTKPFNLAGYPAIVSAITELGTQSKERIAVEGTQPASVLAG